MKPGLLVLVIVAGLLNTIQSGCNTILHKTLQRDYFTAVVVFAVGLLAVLAAFLASGESLPDLAAVRRVSWWVWTGGAFGALYIVSMIFAADKLGAAVFMGVTVTLAILTSLVMDHFGLLGFEVHKAGVARVTGGVLMLSGLGLIAKF